MKQAAVVARVAKSAVVALEEKKADTASLAPWVHLVPGPARRHKKDDEKIDAELAPAVRAVYGLGPGSPPECAADVVAVVLGEHARHSHRLQFFGDKLGSTSSRQQRASWVMVRSGVHMRPVRCERFAEVECVVQRRDGSSTAEKLLLVKVR